MRNITSDTILSYKHVIIFSVLFVMVISCNQSVPEQKGSPAYLAEIRSWHQKRIENLKKENGWLNLAALYWLKNGENKFGTAPDNDFVLPEGKAPNYVGSFFLKDSFVTVKINPGVKVFHKEAIVGEMQMDSDLSGDPTVLRLGSLRWFIIKRGEKFGVRLRNLEAPLLQEFKGIETYPINADWRIEAVFEPYNPPKKLAIPTILGTVEEEISPGALKFQVDGKTYTLDPVGNGKLFLVFADETNGIETYGGGRFLYVDTPDSLGKTIIDFNKAYNPPCVFTKYATCPLPPEQNYLRLGITAGEKNYGEWH